MKSQAGKPFRILLESLGRLDLTPVRRSKGRETEGKTILHLVSAPCLIIDEVGYCGKLGRRNPIFS